MRYGTLVDLMVNMWISSQEKGTPQQTVCLLGPPGTAKTSSGRTLAEKMTEYMRKSNPSAPPAICRELDLSSMLPEDLNGLPFRQQVDSTNADVAEQFLTRFAAHEWLHELCKPGAYGVLVLDDLPAAAPMMQVAARQISLERRVHDHKLSDGVFIITTGNRREDKSAATTLPAHFRNSVMIITTELDVDEWATWYGTDESRDPVVPAFLRWRRERLSMLPKDADKNGAFATPRSWTKLGHQFRVAKDTGCLLEVAAGLVGEGPGREFAAFVKTRAELVDPEKVFDSPEKYLPKPGDTLNTPDKQVAMATALGEIGAFRSKHGDSREREEAPLKLLRAVAWATCDHREYCGAPDSTFIASGGNLSALIRPARNTRKDPVVSKLLTFLKSVLIPGSGVADKDAKD